MFLYRFRLFIKRYTNFQKRLYLFTNLYGSLLRKILEILKYFQYAKIYETMKNVCIEGVRSTLWKYFVWWWVCDNSTILSKFCIYFIYKSLNKIRDSEISIGFHLSYLNDLTSSEKEGCFLVALNKTGRNCLSV